MKLLKCRNQVEQRAPPTVEAPDDNGIELPPARGLQNLLSLRARPSVSAGGRVRFFWGAAGPGVLGPLRSLTRHHDSNPDRGCNRQRGAARAGLAPHASEFRAVRDGHIRCSRTDGRGSRRRSLLGNRQPQGPRLLRGALVLERLRHPLSLIRGRSGPSLSLAGDQRWLGKDGTNPLGTPDGAETRI
jgi:hypothetical protein